VVSLVESSQDGKDDDACQYHNDANGQTTTVTPYIVSNPRRARPFPTICLGFCRVPRIPRPNGAIALEAGLKVVFGSQGGYIPLHVGAQVG
jgi:hypothetical protein